jgi:hypothetical protein
LTESLAIKLRFSPCFGLQALKVGQSLDLAHPFDKKIATNRIEKLILGNI